MGGMREKRGVVRGAGTLNDNKKRFLWRFEASSC